MRIAFVAQPWDEVVPPMRAGSSLALVAWELARRLARHADVTIFARRGAGQMESETDSQGLRLERVRVEKRIPQTLDRVTGFLGSDRPFFASPRYYRGYAERVGRRLCSGRFDAAHLFSLPQHVSILRKASPDTRLALCMQGESLTQLDRERVGSQIRRADLILGCSDYITAGVRRRFPELAHRCRTLYNGVDPAHFEPAEQDPDPVRDPTVLFVGRVSPEKGVHVLIEAFRRVLDAVPTARLELVGGTGLLPYAYHVGLSGDGRVRELERFYGGSLLEKVRRQLLHRDSSYVDDLRAGMPAAVAARVRFRGAVDHRELLGTYRAADVFAFPSVWPEPFGMPVVEAMACGLPVVATRGGGLPEIVAEGESGLLVERGDAEGLAAAILGLLVDPTRRRSMAKVGRERAESRFGWDGAAETLLRYDRELCSKDGDGNARGPT